MAFIAAMLLLIGIYSIVRIGINLAMYNKYPTVGVLNLNFFGPPYIPQRDEDCLNPMSYYTNDGKLRPGTEDELVNEKNQQQICLNSVKAARETTKANDINTALFFVFMGGGFLIVKKFFFLVK